MRATESMKLLSGKRLRAAGATLTGVIAAAGCQFDAWQSAGFGRTDFLKKAPFYVDYGARERSPGIDTATTVGCLAIAVDRAGRTVFLDAGGETALQPLLAAMNARLEKGARCKPLAGIPLPEDGAPILYAGSNDGEGASPGHNDDDDQHGQSRMILSIEPPSKEWRADLARVLQENTVQQLLIIRLGLADYPQSSRGVFGKRVILGTGHERPLKFVTPTDQQIPVLQITGLRLDRDGRILRAGAEGIIARESGLVVRMVLRATELLSPEDLRNAVAARRDDLPGRPLTWEVAFDELVARLL